MKEVWARGECLEKAAGALAADAELLDDRLVAWLVLALHVIEQLAALRDHLEQAAPRMVVLGVGLEVLGEVGDALGEDRDLDLGRPRIPGLVGVIGNDSLLALRRNRHRVSFLGGVGEAEASRTARPGCRPAGWCRCITRLAKCEKPLIAGVCILET